MTELQRILLVGLGNYTYPQTRHSIGMMVLDHLAMQLNLTWNKNKDWPAYVSRTTIYVDPPKVKRKKDRMNKELLKNKVGDNRVEDDNGVIDTSVSAPLSSISPPLSTGFRNTKPEPIPLEITLMKPLLLMNVSGKSVFKAVKELGLSPSNVIVIHDDMQREIGKISLKNGGSANGHNGIKSVIESLRTDSFRRLRVGIGRPPQNIDDRSHEIISKWVLARIPNKEMEFYTNEIFPKCKDRLLEIS
ncbi:3286_t:CDS:2 [Acaulospora morrowiae]|uniref:peptidyl-tRNA hydrolase n=1 Tax=Acaulospora morrowiae TaxID=94023 RepID=A0A9N9AK04_9GLOM|nr:3286_t:CDS:2 [Acaulospora morrowiae]